MLTIPAQVKAPSKQLLKNFLLAIIPKSDTFEYFCHFLKVDLNPILLNIHPLEIN